MEAEARTRQLLVWVAGEARRSLPAPSAIRASSASESASKASARGRAWSGGSDLGVLVRRARDCVVLEVRGELDGASVRKLCAHLEALEHPKTVVVDLRDLTFTDSNGIAALLSAQDRAHAAGGELFLRSPSRTVRRVFEICGLDRALVSRRRLY